MVKDSIKAFYQKKIFALSKDFFLFNFFFVYLLFKKHNK